MGTTVNYANPKTDGTVQIFDQFYDFEVAVPQLQYDAVYSYFTSVFGTNEAAGNFTVTLFRISQNTGVPVMTLLQQFEGQTQPQITLTLAFYLNKLRDKSTLLGVNTAVQPNFYTARNVRA